MSSSLPIFFLLLSAFWGTSIHGAESTPDLQQQYLDLRREHEKISKMLKELEGEAGLAKGNRLYGVLDLGSRELRLKIGGVMLKQIPILDLQRLGGRSCPDVPLVFKRVDTQKKRAQSTPGNTEEGTNGIGVADMPKTYRLAAQSANEAAIWISVQSQPESFLGSSWRWVSATVESLSYSVGQAFGSQELNFRLTLVPEQAQALYWAAGDEIPGIILCE